MAIPESQLETWSHQGSITQSKDTYQRIRNVLTDSSTPYASKSYSVFLQGSYGNDTNIYAESDVDVVIKLDDCFHSDLSTLSQEEKDAYARTFPDASYTHAHFKRDVLQVLSNAYGSDVNAGTKAIAIKANGNRRKADVIPAVQYRRYHKFKGEANQSYDEGICFFTASGEQIASYPKQHSANLTTKHQGTGQWLKPMVRILKNMRSRLVDDGTINAGVAPSYFIEGLLYNVPSTKFGGSYGDSFVRAMNWIQKEADKEKLVCANEQYYLLRDETHNCWPTADGEAFLNAVIGLWDNW